MAASTKAAAFIAVVAAAAAVACAGGALGAVPGSGAAALAPVAGGGARFADDGSSSASAAGSASVEVVGASGTEQVPDAAAAPSSAAVVQLAQSAESPSASGSSGDEPFAPTEQPSGSGSDGSAAGGGGSGPDDDSDASDDSDDSGADIQGGSSSESDELSPSKRDVMETFEGYVRQGVNSHPHLENALVRLDNAETLWIEHKVGSKGDELLANLFHRVRVVGATRDMGGGERSIVVHSVKLMYTPGLDIYEAEPDKTEDGSSSDGVEIPPIPEDADGDGSNSLESNDPWFPQE